MYYAKQKIYETPLMTVDCVSTETGFAVSDDVMNTTEGSNDSGKWTFGE